MSSTGNIHSDHVWEMLRAYGEGQFRIEQKPHLVLVFAPAISQPGRLPSPPHGRKLDDRYPIKVTSVRTLARHLNVFECAKEHLAQLNKGRKVKKKLRHSR